MPNSPDWDKVVIRSRFVMEDLTLYPPREVAVMPSPKITSDKDLSIPTEMGRIVYLPRCLRTEDLTDLLRRSHLAPESPGTATCVVCGQRANEFYLFVTLEDVPNRGWCPRHLYHLEWKREWKELGWTQDQSSVRPSLEEFIRLKEEETVQRYNREDLEWWMEQEAANTPLFQEYSRRRGNIKQNTGSAG